MKLVSKKKQDLDIGQIRDAIKDLLKS